jgi:SanA protein
LFSSAIKFSEKCPGRLLKAVLIASAAFLLLLTLSNIWIINVSEGKNYSYVAEVPENEVGLILGTSKYNRSGHSNDFFHNRIEAAVSLYNAGKIRHIIVSGDNREMNYNEPRDMRRALEKKGIPSDAITLDFAGFRTLDSVVRSKKVFGQNKITIISQKFHNQRALFIADYYGIDAVGFCAINPPDPSFYPTFVREIFARFLAVIDLYILRQNPKFLGNPEKIIIS